MTSCVNLSGAFRPPHGAVRGEERAQALRVARSVPREVAPLDEPVEVARSPRPRCRPGCGHLASGTDGARLRRAAPPSGRKLELEAAIRPDARSARVRASLVVPVDVLPERLGKRSARDADQVRVVEPDGIAISRRASRISGRSSPRPRALGRLPRRSGRSGPCFRRMALRIGPNSIAVLLSL